MTNEDAIKMLKSKMDGNTDTSYEWAETVREAIKALEIVEEFEKAQIITGGRLNGRTYAYKCGLEDGKRKALEQQSEDCVSRASVKELFQEGCVMGMYDFLGIDDLPPVTPTQSWIPVSERLPKKTGWYFVTFRFANGVAVCEASYRKPENYWTGKNISKKLFDNNEVVAWQPLPKPYEEKRGSENADTI